MPNSLSAPPNVSTPTMMSFGAADHPPNPVPPNDPPGRRCSDSSSASSCLSRPLDPRPLYDPLPSDLYDLPAVFDATPFATLISAMPGDSGPDQARAFQHTFHFADDGRRVQLYPMDPLDLIPYRAGMFRRKDEDIEPRGRIGVWVEEVIGAGLLAAVLPPRPLVTEPDVLAWLGDIQQKVKSEAGKAPPGKALPGKTPPARDAHEGSGSKDAAGAPPPAGLVRKTRMYELPIPSPGEPQTGVLKPDPRVSPEPSDAAWESPDSPSSSVLLRARTPTNTNSSPSSSSSSCSSSGGGGSSSSDSVK